MIKKVINKMTRKLAIGRTGIEIMMITKINNEIVVMKKVQNMINMIKMKDIKGMTSMINMINMIVLIDTTKIETEKEIEKGKEIEEIETKTEIDREKERDKDNTKKKTDRDPDKRTKVIIKKNSHIETANMIEKVNSAEIETWINVEMNETETSNRKKKKREAKVKNNQGVLAVKKLRKK